MRYPLSQDSIPFDSPLLITMNVPPLWWVWIMNLFPDSHLVCIHVWFPSCISGESVVSPVQGTPFSAWALDFPLLLWSVLPWSSLLLFWSLLPLPLLLGELSGIWQGVAQMSPGGSLWLVWPQGGVPFLYCDCVPRVLRQLEMAFGMYLLGFPSSG